ncbi:MAG: type VI secretion system amidase effector protein Tae4 [Burkholderiaceae bacterium]|jgi:hypothetical protein|nr:type VI secretion system amidase effector protein Tae4 [Burkholderiaceae bacterium]
MTLFFQNGYVALIQHSPLKQPQKAVAVSILRYTPKSNIAFNPAASQAARRLIQTLGSAIHRTGQYQNKRPIMLKPSFQSLYDNFPDHSKYGNLENLYDALGGTAKKNINAPGFGSDGNTCASRMSVAFNKAGTPIDGGIALVAGARTVSTADGSLIIYAVADFRKYLFKALGQPLIDNTSPYDDAFHGRKGIIAFSVNWKGATGHIALWNGAAYREPLHDNYSTYIDLRNPNTKTWRGEFWELR